MKDTLDLVSRDGLALRQVEFQNAAIAMAAVMQNPTAIKYVRYQTQDLCIAALLGSPESAPFIEVQTPEVLALAEELGVTLPAINSATKNLYTAADIGANAYYNSIRDIPTRTLSEAARSRMTDQTPRILAYQDADGEEYAQWTLGIPTLRWILTPRTGEVFIVAVRDLSKVRRHRVRTTATMRELALSAIDQIQTEVVEI